MGRRARILGAVVVSMLATAAGASAADRYASPTGTSLDPCTQAQPCDIVTAVNNASTGDDVTIEPGTYGSPTPISTNLTDAGNALTIHGEAGQPRPVINTTASYGFNLNGGSTLSDVEIDDSFAGAYGFYASGPNATIDHVYVHVSGAGSWACYPNATMIDSVCWASGPSGVAVTELISGSVTGTLRNDTLIASGTGGYAVGVYGEGATMTIDMTNTIAHGTAADVYATTGADPASKAVVNADHSNYATVTEVPVAGTITVTPAGSGTNQKAAPQFADAAAGNFHELAGSPTVGAGIDSASNGATDLDGIPREIAGRTDIGAYELVPPPTCKALTATTDAGKPVPVSLGCTDALGAPVTYAIVTRPSHGTVSAPTSTGTVVYTAAKGYGGPDSFTYEATSSHGTSAPTPVSITVVPAPAISKLKQSHRTWLERKPRHHSKTPVGTTFSFTLSQPAKVTLKFTQGSGRHVHSRGTLTVRARAGTTKLKFAGRLSKHKQLKPGKYALIVTATGPGGTSKPQRLSFTIAG